MSTNITITCDDCGAEIDPMGDRITVIVNRPQTIPLSVSLDYHPDHAPQWAKDALEPSENGA